MAGHFTDLMAWKEAIELLAEVKQITKLFRGPDAPQSVRQLIDAAESVSSNIAEGFGKGYCPDNVRFIKIALASADEVESRLRSSVAAERVDQARIDMAVRRARRTQSLTHGWLRYVESRSRKAG